MKYLFAVLMLLSVGCAKMEAVNLPETTPFKVWACEFENAPGLYIVLDLRDGEFGKRAIFVEFIFDGDDAMVLAIDYEMHRDRVLHYGESLGGPEVRELEYSFTEDTMVIVDAAEGMQPGMGNLICHDNLKEFL